MKRVIATLLAFTILRSQTFLIAQQNSNSDEGLKLKLVGDGEMLGRHTAFRTYTASDGTEVLVWYGKFKSEHEAMHATKQWLKGYKVTSKIDAKDASGRVIGNRIAAAPKQSGKVFVVIAIRGLNYWFIQSVSPDCRNAVGRDDRSTTR